MNKFIESFTDVSLMRPYQEKFQPIHIFHKLVEYYADQLSITDIEFLYGQFEDVENALGLSRRRELHTAGLIFGKITAQQFEYPEVIRNGMLSMVKAAAAYYDYACGRNEEAFELLEQAIGHSIAQSIGFPLMLTATQFQWCSIVRVRSRQGDLNGALSENSALISFSLTGEASGVGVEERFHCSEGGVICDRFLQMEPEVHHAMLSIVTGSAFKSAIEYCNYDFSLASNLYGQIIREAVGAMQGRRVIQWARTPILLLHLFYTGQTERFLEGISEQFDDLLQAVPSLQWLIISNYINLSHEAGFDLESHPNYKRFMEAYRGTGLPTDLLKPAAQEMG